MVDGDGAGEGALRAVEAGVVDGAWQMAGGAWHVGGAKAGGGGLG